MGILYFAIAFFATVCGSMAGLGGGVIIKPVLDALGLDNIQTISILSSTTVFSMALVSTVKQFLSGFRIQKRMVFLVIGATLGGLAGMQLFSLISGNMEPQMLKGVQSIILASLLIVVLFKNKLPDFDIENLFLSVFLGLLLGTMAAFLGIGGGPINVVILCMFLGMQIKDAAVVSILIILFSQGAKLTMIQIDTGFKVFENLYKLLYMVPAGIIGGLLGAAFNRKLSNEFIHTFFMVMIVAILGLNIFNAVNAFFL
ncbi:MAG: sulfite exporter TauE/SafE family protein [Spirochaetales bacterium]|nr:sulfite exporter TauE/SafE family protein [Spirochaetales bacterium]